jgi:hypothetical protein
VVAPIDLTELGMFNEAKLSHSTNTDFPMEIKEEEDKKSTEAKREH